jgi:hypothetical protein
VNRKEAIIKALNRLVVSGKIVKLSKGKIYKPETTVFGILQPDQSQVVKDLLEGNSSIAGPLRKSLNPITVLSYRVLTKYLLLMPP